MRVIKSVSIKKSHEDFCKLHRYSLSNLLQDSIEAKMIEHTITEPHPAFVDKVFNLEERVKNEQK